MRHLTVCLVVICAPLVASAQGFPPPGGFRGGPPPGGRFGGPARGPQPTLTVMDEQDKPVPKFEVFVHTPDKGYVSWKAGTNGYFQLEHLVIYRTSPKIDVLVRAVGYAPLAKTFTGEALEQLRNTGARITLERGRELRLKLRLPSGMSFPKDLSPDFYFPDFAWRVEMMWQPVNRRDGRPVPDFNMVGAKPVDGAPGEYLIRLPSEKINFFVGIYHDGWLRYFKVGPLAAENFENNELTIDVPRPASIAVRLDWGGMKPDDLPFSGVQYRLGRETGRGTLWIAATQETGLDRAPLEVADLAPGGYSVTASTKPKVDDGNTRPDRPINTGRFSSRIMLDLQPGQPFGDIIPYVPFNPDAYRGDRTARIRILGVDGMPAAGKQLKVSWYDGHYGSLTVFDGPIPDDGVVKLEGISSAVNSTAPFGPYSLTVDGERLGFFRLDPNEPTQEFAFSLLAKPGNVAPDIELVALESGERIRLKDLQGQFVYLEFWETGCGPCQPQMAKLNAIAAAEGKDWSGKVALVPVCLDPDPEVISTHVKTRGWTNLRHYRSERTGGEFFADAQRAFGVMAYPTSFLIDRNSRIVWRGHPAEHDLVTEVQRLERVGESRR